MQDNTHVISNELDEAEFIDQSVWVPKGEEVVPAHMFLNRHAVAQGTHFVSTWVNKVDKLLHIGCINQDHHATAIRLINLYRLGTSRQDYAVMKMFMLPKGYDSSEFCPMHIFIRATSGLKHSAMHWVRLVVGIETCDFEYLAINAPKVQDALERVAANILAYEEQQEAKNSLNNELSH